MPRGFKRDSQATSDYSRFLDPRSFVSQPKIIRGECDEPKAHLILYGSDKGPVRAEIFRRSREANGGVNRCWKCECIVFENEERALLACPHNFRMTSYSAGEWDHIRSKPGERCDCEVNGRVACQSCHKKSHVRVRFGQSKIV